MSKGSLMHTFGEPRITRHADYFSDMGRDAGAAADVVAASARHRRISDG